MIYLLLFRTHFQQQECQHITAVYTYKLVVISLPLNMLTFPVLRRPYLTTDGHLPHVVLQSQPSNRRASYTMLTMTCSPLNKSDHYMTGPLSLQLTDFTKHIVYFNSLTYDFITSSVHKRNSKYSSLCRMLSDVNFMD